MRKNIYTNNKAFTLIELLVVIVIIGILATLATVALTSSRANARDARRISDLKQISTALELYQADNNAYPSTITFGSALVGTGNKTYMAKVPTNPSPRAEGACGDIEYQYAGNASDYSLIGCLAKASGEIPAGARVLSIGGTARNLGPTAGMVGWWMLDSLNGTRDLSGGFNTGNIYGDVATSTGRFGESGGAYLFDGASDYVQIADSASVKPNYITTALWFKTSNKTLFQCILSKTEAGSFQVSLNNNGGICGASSLCFLVYVSGTYYAASIPVASISNDTWYHVAGTYDGANIKLYLNGLVVSTTAQNGSGITHSTTPLCIGSESRTGNCTGGSYTEGSVSDVRLYNRALSDTEVNQLWSATKP